jgi:hypothetical protein
MYLMSRFFDEAPRASRALADLGPADSFDWEEIHVGNRCVQIRKLMKANGGDLPFTESTENVYYHAQPWPKPISRTEARTSGHNTVIIQGVVVELVGGTWSTKRPATEQDFYAFPVVITKVGVVG